jgi:hypothetical protein
MRTTEMMSAPTSRAPDAADAAGDRRAADDDGGDGGQQQLRWRASASRSTAAPARMTPASAAKRSRQDVGDDLHAVDIDARGIGRRLARPDRRETVAAEPRCSAGGGRLTMADAGRQIATTGNAGDGAGDPGIV